MRFSPDGRLLAITLDEHVGVSRGPLQVFDARSGRQQFSIAADWDRIEAFLFSPDSSLLAVYQADKHLNLWDVWQAQQASSLTPAMKLVSGVGFCFTPDSTGLLVQGFGDWTHDRVQLFDLASKKRALIEATFSSNRFPSKKEMIAWQREDGKPRQVRRWRFVDREPILMPLTGRAESILGGRFSQ